MLFPGIFFAYFNKKMAVQVKILEHFWRIFLKKYVSLHCLYPRCANQEG